jgi:hypothetical protein
MANMYKNRVDFLGTSVSLKPTHCLPDAIRASETEYLLQYKPPPSPCSPSDPRAPQCNAVIITALDFELSRCSRTHLADGPWWADETLARRARAAN